MKMQLHILTPVFLLVSSLFFLFSTDHPLAICGVFCWLYAFSQETDSGIS